MNHAKMKIIAYINPSPNLNLPHNRLKQFEMLHAHKKSQIRGLSAALELKQSVSVIMQTNDVSTQEKGGKFLLFSLPAMWITITLSILAVMNVKV